MKGESWEAPEIPEPPKVLNVRFKRAEEAEKIILEWLDDLFRHEVKKATIIHGKSGGVLKRVSRDILKKDKRVDEVKSHDEKGNASLGAVSFTMHQE